MDRTMAVTEVPSPSQIWERVYPCTFGVIAGAVVLIFWPGGYLFAEANHWKLDVLFGAGFEFSAVATSFLFTFYTFVLTAERGFIARMRRSVYFGMLIDYTMNALRLGAIFAIASLLMEVFEPHPAVRWDIPCIAWSLWSFLAVWTLAAFVRTTIIFAAFASADT